MHPFAVVLSIASAAVGIVLAHSSAGVAAAAAVAPHENLLKRGNHAIYRCSKNTIFMVEEATAARDRACDLQSKGLVEGWGPAGKTVTFPRRAYSDIKLSSETFYFPIIFDERSKTRSKCYDSSLPSSSGIAGRCRLKRVLTSS